MAMFVHLTAESLVARILRDGIRGGRVYGQDFRRAVFAVPLTADFYGSHQWLRELKRGHGTRIAGVYFRLPDSERVWVGRYKQEHRWMTAAAAARHFREAADSRGWQVIIPRPIEAREIHSRRRLPQVIGWRYYPEAKGNRPYVCECCTRGEYGSRRLRQRLYT